MREERERKMKESTTLINNCHNGVKLESIK